MHGSLAAWLLAAACAPEDTTAPGDLLTGDAAPATGERDAGRAGTGDAGGWDAGRHDARDSGAQGPRDPQDPQDPQGPDASAEDDDAAPPGQPTAPEPKPQGFYRMEALDRGLVVVPTAEGAFVSFRMLGGEYDPERPERITYRLLRDGTPIATLEHSTSYLDRGAPRGARYSVEPLIDGAVLPRSPEASAWSQTYLRIPLSPPGPAYQANDGSVGDVDGDGRYELFLKWDPDNARDNSQAGVTDPVFIDALTLDGERLWRINLGRNIRAGAHYTQFIVYDLDGDGRAELVAKTAPGTRDGTGAYLRKGPAANDDDNADYRNGEGYVLRGPEYLTVFDGLTGVERDTINYVPARGNVSSWGDNYGNRVDRFLATAAYLDDTGLPSVVMARGYYTRTVLAAFRYREGKLSEQWVFDSDKTPRDRRGQPFTGQGCHSLSVANVDGDLPQEIVYGAMTVDHDGRGMCSTGLGHGDALHVTDLIPSRPGLESFMPHESASAPAWSLRDPASCEVIRLGPATSSDVGRGVAADVFPQHPGAELWTSGGFPMVSASTGQELPNKPRAINFVIWWDGDAARDLLDGVEIRNYENALLLRADGCLSNNGTKSTPVLSADLFGDFREEVVFREADNRALRVYTSTFETSLRLFTLMHDPQYRVAIAWQNVGYNQPPHPSFALEAQRPLPKAPNIRY